MKLPEATARKLKLMQLTLMLSDAGDREAYTRLAAKLERRLRQGGVLPHAGQWQQGRMSPAGQTRKDSG
ncbi:hypothetical protein LP419_05590 [Massilia sp. H-1]|nr:hypothetical protein LP419_05590 [Massilia sp. H-1]